MKSTKSGEWKPVYEGYLKEVFLTYMNLSQGGRMSMIQCRREMGLMIVKEGTCKFIFGAGTLLLAGGQWVADGSGKTPFLVAVAFHFVSNLGWLFVVPTLNALYTRLAPKTVNATLFGINATAVTWGSFISGRIGGYYEHMSSAQFWGLHAAIVGAGGVLMLLMGAHLRREFGRAGQATAG